MLTPANIFNALALLGNILFYTYLFTFLLCLLIAWIIVGKAMENHRWRRRLQSVACLAVTALFMIPIGKDYIERQTYIRKQQAKRDEFQARYNKAKAIFDERCKTAGEKIYHTVEGVEGITLLNVPQEYTHALIDDPMWEGAALPYSGGGNNYIRNFLDWELRSKSNTPQRSLRDVDPSPRNKETFKRIFGYEKKLEIDDRVYDGYSYTDVRQPDGSYLRYQYPSASERKDRDTIITTPLDRKPARYAVEYSPLLILLIVNTGLQD
ncbi:hypothetical protein [uncultured Cardiobacterium sp.]|uniref:hypothetical protein n=1 Tax=uncultured Cardiobacterium sp. TaxID=417619 RepID=UPI00261FFD79|nr:hypothetical protein [uncultured Cardiobacterium sp.]